MISIKRTFGAILNGRRVVRTTVWMEWIPYMLADWIRGRPPRGSPVVMVGLMNRLVPYACVDPKILGLHKRMARDGSSGAVCPIGRPRSKQGLRRYPTGCGEWGKPRGIQGRLSPLRCLPTRMCSCVCRTQSVQLTFRCGNNVVGPGSRITDPCLHLKMLTDRSGWILAMSMDYTHQFRNTGIEVETTASRPLSALDALYDDFKNI